MIQVANVNTYPLKLPNTNPIPTVFYIGREMPGYPASPFANPFKVGKDGTLEECLAKYEEAFGWLIVNIPSAQKMIQDMAQAADREGCVLLCWCSPRPCHGDIIKREIERQLDIKHQVEHDLAEFWRKKQEVL